MTAAIMTKMKAGDFRIPVVLTKEKGRIFFQFAFNRPLMAEVKVMKGSRWHGYDNDNPRKVWSVKDCERNRFQIDFLRGGNPYSHYDKELLSLSPKRKILYEHQGDMFRHGLTYRQVLFACEMGTGKTLAAIEVMEKSGYIDWVWIGPRSALTEVQLQFDEWEAAITPIFMTYEKLRSLVKEDDFLLPSGIVFDESSKIKTATAQRSQAAAIVAEAMREKNPDCYIILMSGAPAPKSPVDWWHQCEVACPGFLREGDSNRLKQRLALIQEKESVTGGVYPELVTWFDDEKKCKTCGKLRDEHFNQDDLAPEDHPFAPSINEVAYLYKRMKGLVLVKFKKDCLDLPELQYRLITVKSSESVKRAANLILKTTSRTVTALMLLRELSDGFQYREEASGETRCPRCKGSATTIEYIPGGDGGTPKETGGDIKNNEQHDFIEHTETCSNCRGTGKVKGTVRVTKEVMCPKEQVLIDLLDEHEPIGRFAVYAGFQASVDRCVKIALRYQWDVIRVDGRGWAYYTALSTDSLQLTDKEMLQRFKTAGDTKIVYIAQPGAGGMGLNLTASPTIFFYSNTFNADDRMQAVERIHRIGMDENRGATIIDVVHLDMDKFVLSNLKKKKDLLNLSMGKLREAAKEYENVPA